MSADEMIACLGSCRARGEIAAMIKALSLHPWLNTPTETKRLEAARAAMRRTSSARVIVMMRRVVGPHAARSPGRPNPLPNFPSRPSMAV